jgi:hypothetical protein
LYFMCILYECVISHKSIVSFLSDLSIIDSHTIILHVMYGIKIFKKIKSFCIVIIYNFREESWDNCKSFCSMAYVCNFCFKIS